MPTDTTNPSDTDWEVEEEDFTPEGPLKPDQEIIDGNFIVDKNGVRRRANGWPIPGGQGIRPAGKKAQSFREFKHSLLIAFHANGGTAWLTEWGRDHPALFFKLMTKMVPQAVNVDGVKTAVEVNVTWATEQRLSYQRAELIEAAPAPPGTWRGTPPDGLAQTMRLADKKSE